MALAKTSAGSMLRAVHSCSEAPSAWAKLTELATKTSHAGKIPSVVRRPLARTTQKSHFDGNNISCCSDRGVTLARSVGGWNNARKLRSRVKAWWVWGFLQQTTPSGFCQPPFLSWRNGHELEKPLFRRYFSRKSHGIPPSHSMSATSAMPVMRVLQCPIPFFLQQMSTVGLHMHLCLHWMSTPALRFAILDVPGRKIGQRT